MKKDLLLHLMNKFGISKEEYEKHKDYYNNHFEEYSNEIYMNLKTRLVHLNNFSEKNWFNDRYRLFFNKYKNFDCIIEIGFSLPYLMLINEMEDLAKLPSLIYIEKEDSALKVSKEITDFLRARAKFVKADIEKAISWDKIKPKNTSNTLLVAIELLEHLKKPTIFWKNVKIINPSKIIISLPIGPKIPSHHLSFNTVDEARNYLGRYIKIQEEEIIEPSKASERNIDKYKDIIVYGVLK